VIVILSGAGDSQMRITCGVEGPLSASMMQVIEARIGILRFAFSMYRTKRKKKEDMDFQINGNTYFVNLAESEGWQVLVSTPTGARSIPVYDDAPDIDDELTIVVQDERKRRIVN
jgi:hypothetical protein